MPYPACRGFLYTGTYLEGRVARSATVGSINASDLLEALRRLGAAGPRLLRSVGLTPEDLRDPEARVPSSKVLALFETAERQLRDPLVGLHAGESVHTRGPLFYLLLSAARFNEGLDLLARFARVSLDTQQMGIDISGDIVSLTVDPGDPAINQSHHAIDYIMGAILGSMRRAVPGFRPTGMDLAHRQVGDRAEVERAFGCPVRFNCRRNVLRFPVSTLKRTPVAANTAIAAQIKSYSAALLSRVISDKMWDRAADVIRTLLVDGVRADRRMIARRLFVSERTLKRRLRQEGTTFKAVRDRVRVETARALLTNRVLKVEAVARSVGFAETASFSKAFARWSGYSPTRYRERLSVGRNFRASPRSGARPNRPVARSRTAMHAGR
jgi:AraC-like DNA-binding protein